MYIILVIPLFRDGEQFLNNLETAFSPGLLLTDRLILREDIVTFEREYVIHKF